MKSFNDILRAGLCMLCALALIEIAMRASGQRFQASFYMSEAERGYSLRPGAEGWNVGENQNYVRINSRGLRDREHDLKRPDDTIRIAVIGDSESEAVQLPLEQTYFSVAERELNCATTRSPKVEVINFGVGGYGLGPQYVTVAQRIWQYDPQMVIVADPMDALIMRTTRRLYFGDSFGAPFYDLHDGNLELDAQSAAQRAATAGRRPEWSADLMNQSRLLSLVNSARVRAQNDLRQMTSRFHAKAAAASPFPQDYWRTFPYQGEANADLKDAWRISEALMLAIRDEVARHHAEFWLFTLDMPGQVEPDKRKAAELQARLGVESLFQSDRLYAEFAEREGILHQALAPEMEKYATEHNSVLHGFKGMPRNTGHLNQAGHFAVGHLIAETLRLHSPLLSKESGNPR